ncbi:MAG: protein kinase, partial [Gemmataceae bacterium]
MQRWFYTRAGTRQGPVSWDELAQLAADRQLEPDDLVQAEGGEKAVPASQVEGLGFPDTDRPEGESTDSVPATADSVASVASVSTRTSDSITPLLNELAARERVQVPGYLIQEELGRGGMGVVYKAEQIALKRLVALKLILAGSHASSKHRARFLTEAEAIARLQHPNIVQVYDVGTGNGQLFIALEYVAGPNLAREMARKPMGAMAAARLLHLLAGGIEAAHQRGIVHRDLKPGNILLDHAGTPKISDFGLAKLADDESGHTLTGDVMGTPSYMAPEQARGDLHAIGPATDIYALGAVLYEMLTGRPPFRAEVPAETILQVLNEEPVPPSQLQRQVPKDLETICLRCLDKDPRRRYPSAAALAEDLRRFLDGEPIAARPIGRPERAWRWCRRHPARASALGLGLLTAVLLIVVPVVVALRDRANADRRESA